MQTELILPAPAKLNLFLHILGRRSDGYHNLQTLFQFLDFGDSLSFKLTADKNISLSPTLNGVAPEDNLIMQAARILQQEAGIAQGVEINLKKRLPMGGGLGGGSSDAATTLLGLNALWQAGLSLKQLAKLGLQLGADVPVFVHGYSAFAEGVGERLTPVKPPADWFLVATPDVHVNTAAMFGHRDLTRDSLPITVSAALDQWWRNDFESLVRTLYPAVDKTLSLLDHLVDFSGGPAMMSGSGASVFARFSNRNQALAAQAELQTQYLKCFASNKLELRSFVARGVNCSPLHTALSSVNA